MHFFKVNVSNKDIMKRLLQVSLSITAASQRPKGTMEALVFDGKTLKVKYYTNFPKPEIRKNSDVIVKVEYSGICGTDVHIIQGDFPARKSPPFPLGHEFSGIVDSTGKKSIFKPGQYVSIYPCSGCNLCEFCRTGNYHHCANGGLNNYMGIFKDGGWAQYCLVPQEQVYLLPDEVTTQQGSLAEPLSCVVHTFNRAAPLKIGQKILILGAGIIGNLFASGLHHQGHRDVTISEANRSRLDLCRNIDTGFKLITPDVLSSEKSLYDVIFDCTGVGKVMTDSFWYMRQGGKYLVFGCCPQTDITTISPYEIFDKELSIIGVKTNPYTYFSALKWIQAMGSRYIDFDKLGVKIYELANYENALSDLKSRRVAKATFKMTK